MKRSRPTYFDSIRQGAAKTWKQLEGNPELAGPWHQLFKQVQSPRHVLSELLQNADDAGAKKAMVTLEGDDFVFSHDGEDFIEDHFVSLCRFGYSSKRALHTIGFRGIGFKSVFSLGESVHLDTPTLSVAFHRDRFTLPEWQGGDRKTGDPLTYIRVPLQDSHRRKDLLKNLDEWRNSPVSLLFFRSLRSLAIQGDTLHWRSDGLGPVSNSEWMIFDSTEGGVRHLRLWSDEVDFPPEAQLEIQQERLLLSGEKMVLPPARVEIVLGSPGFLYVVLPTGVHTDLPFACNAPFIQDPARVKIKDPETSATNRWLLERIGRLAATSMAEWAGSKKLGAEERGHSYQLLPPRLEDGTSLGESCAAAVVQAFEQAIDDAQFILTIDEKTVGRQEAVHLPAILYEIWPKSLVTDTFAHGTKSILHPVLSDKTVERLFSWSLIRRILPATVLGTLAIRKLPKPKGWQKLLQLWSFVYTSIGGSYYGLSNQRTGLPSIVPIQGHDMLFPPDEVVRLGDKQLLQSDEDWEFLSNYLLVLNPNWIRFLNEQRRSAAGQESLNTNAYMVDHAFHLLDRFRLASASELVTVTEKISRQFCATKQLGVPDYVRFTRIVAKLGGQVPDAFEYFTGAEQVARASSKLLVDLDHDFDQFLPPDILSSRVLHDDYLHSLNDSCTTEEWHSWLRSAKSRLGFFPEPTVCTKEFYSQAAVSEMLRELGLPSDVSTKYARNHFRVDNWDFSPQLWVFWNKKAKSDPTFWRRLLSRILAQGKSFWDARRSAKVVQQSQQRATHIASDHPIPAPWILRLRTLPCLVDSNGNLAKPGDLFCRTDRTEPLLGTEPFVTRDVDTEQNRQLLIMLGVRTKPDGSDRLIQQLASIIKNKLIDMSELQRLYRALDRLAEHASTTELDIIRRQFSEQRLILTATGERTTSSGIFIHPDEDDAPGAAVIHPAFQQLTLWRRLGLSERPTVELAILWLRTFDSEAKLGIDDQRRVKNLLAKYPERVWHECRHWISLEGAWMPVRRLTHFHSTQSLVQTKHLFPAVRGKVADFTKLPLDLCSTSPFSDLRPLSVAIEERFDGAHDHRGTPTELPWLKTLARLLRRVVLPSPEDTDRMRRLAARLEETRCIRLEEVLSTPYLDGAPAGPARELPAAWIEHALYIRKGSRASTAKAVADVVGAAFSIPEVQSALQFCSDRPPQFVTEYTEETFELAAELPTALSDVAEVDAPDPASRSPHAATVIGSDSDGSFGGPRAGLDEESLLPGFSAGEHGTDEEQFPPGKTSSRPRKTSFIERYAASKGFIPTVGGGFEHPTGVRLEHQKGALFNWLLRDPHRDLERQLLPIDHCLLVEPLELPHEIWAYCQKFPEACLFILADAQGEPCELRGEDLQQLSKLGVIGLHPASYRLRCEDGEQLHLRMQITRG